MQFGKGTQLQFRRAYLPTGPLEDEDDDEDSLPDEALRSVVGSSVNERSRENDVPHERHYILGVSSPIGRNREQALSAATFGANIATFSTQG